MPAPAAYLRTALVHDHVSGLRRLGRRLRTSGLEGHDRQGADEAASVDQRDATWRLLATLPRRQRAVLALRYHEDRRIGRSPRLSALRQGDQTHLGDRGEHAVARDDAHGVAERTAALELDLAVEAVPAAVVAVGELERGDRGLHQVVVAVDDAVHDLDRDVVGRQ